jgi:hypothetical protein
MSSPVPARVSERSYATVARISQERTRDSNREVWIGARATACSLAELRNIRRLNPN